MKININYDPSVDQNADPSKNAPAGFKFAINYVVNLFDHLFTNNVTMTIHVGWGEFGGQPIAKDAIGENRGPLADGNVDNIGPYNFTTIASKLHGLANSSAVRKLAYGNLPATNPFPSNVFTPPLPEAEAWD